MDDNDVRVVVDDDDVEENWEESVSVEVVEVVEVVVVVVVVET